MLKYDNIWSDSIYTLCFSLCIFCGKKDESFTEDGLDLHYWKYCPMLRRCDECKQVDCYISKILHEKGTPAQLFNHYLINTAWRFCVQLHIIFTGSRDSQPHRAPAGWMWKKVQVQPLSTLLGGCGHWRSGSPCSGSCLQPWVLFHFFVPVHNFWKCFEQLN